MEASMAAAVVDASVLVDLLLTPSPVARSALAGTDPFAPELIDADATSAIARAVRNGAASKERGVLAVRRLARASIERVPLTPLLLDAWELRRDLSTYDAFYVALARRLACPLITADRRIAAATGLGVAVVLAAE
jgi:predicted nucleic acid-binding protein